jgi:predicted RNase H-like nuclease
MPEAMDVFIGFDSAWTDRNKGAICAVGLENSKPAWFHEPRCVSFGQALAFVLENRSLNGVTLVAIDQPIIVKNVTGMRPVDRVAASFISWLGGGVQPANRGRRGMFCDASPIWRFIDGLGAVQNPEYARAASEGLYLIEVFPALALASFDSSFCGRLCAPKYNPARRKTFRLHDFARVALAAAKVAGDFGCSSLAQWCHDCASNLRPRKADQDMLDCALCLFIGMHWRLRPASASLLLGNQQEGYIVTPVTAAVRARLVS